MGSVALGTISQVPAHVIVLYCTGLTCAPLAVFVPPPARVAAHAPEICRALLAAGLCLLAGGMMVLALGPWWAGMTLGGMALICLMLMFWIAAEPWRRSGGDGDDEGSDGGGGRPLLPQPKGPDAPDGLDIDWGEFDRQREAWGRTPEPAAPIGRWP
jgi:hypothetical protein